MTASSTYKPQIDPAVIRDTSISPAAFRVFCMLSFYADRDTGECFPSQQRLADDLGIGLRSVGRHIKSLLTAGHIVETKRRRRGTIIYRIGNQDRPPMADHTEEDTPPVADQGNQDRPSVTVKTGHPATLRSAIPNITPYTPPVNQTREPDKKHLPGKATTKANQTKSETRLIKSWYPAWFEVYPSEGGELGGKQSFPKAIRHISKKRDLPIEAARDWLMETTREFAASERGSGQYCPYANRFLAEAEFDKPSLWNPGRDGSGSYQESKPLTPPAVSDLR